MEKKKLLIVAVSVGVVLLIIIAIPLLMIGSRQNVASTPYVERDWVTNFDPGVERVLTSSETVVEPLNISANSPDESVPPQPVEAPQFTLTVPVPQTAAVPDTPPAQPKRTPTVNLSQPSKPATTKPAESAKSATPAPAAKPATVAKADSSKANNNYWVQTGAFSTKVRAEGAKESLASKGITSIIDNRNIDGKTWYRVRVGPYMSENEAKYWLALVKSIDGFTDSQIRQTQVQ
jgi:DedD protein